MRRCNWNILLASGAVIIAGGAGTPVTEYHSLGALGESNEAPSRRQIETALGIRIPPDATELRARLDQVMTKRTAFVRFSLPRTSFESFLAETPFHEPLWQADAIPDLLAAEPRPDWFRPPAGVRSLAGETARAAILVDTTDPLRWVIYLVVRS
jgi:hypothetical protein